MRLIDIYNAKPALDVLDNMLLPVKDSMQIMSIIDTLEPHIRHFKKLSDKLFVEYGTSEDNQHYVVVNTKEKPDNVEKYAKEREELENTEIDIKKEKIQLRANLVIKPSHLKALKKVLDVEVI